MPFTGAILRPARVAGPGVSICLQFGFGVTGGHQQGLKLDPMVLL